MRKRKRTALRVPERKKLVKKQDDSRIWNEVDNIRYDLNKIEKVLKNKAYNESVNEAPDHDLARALKYINNDIFRVLVKYEGKADIEKAVHSWMLGLHAKLKKFGIKL